MNLRARILVAATSLALSVLPALAATPGEGTNTVSWSGDALTANPLRCYPMDNPSCDQFLLTLGTPLPTGFCHCVFVVSTHGWSTEHIHAESPGCATSDTPPGQPGGCWIAVYPRAQGGMSPFSTGNLTDRLEMPVATGWGDVWMGAAQGYYTVVIGAPADAPALTGVPATTLHYTASATLICSPTLGC